MPRIDTFTLSQAQRDLLVEWVTAEGLDASEIVNDGRFSVHNGWVSGNQLITAYDGTPLGKVHFRKTQANPLPPELEN